MKYNSGAALTVNWWISVKVLLKVGRTFCFVFGLVKICVFGSRCIILKHENICKTPLFIKTLQFVLYRCIDDDSCCLRRPPSGTYSFTLFYSTERISHTLYSGLNENILYWINISYLTKTNHKTFTFLFYPNSSI